MTGSDTGGAFTPDGPVAAVMADLWWLMLALGTAVFVLFGVLLWRGLRHDPGPGPDEDGDRAGDAGARRWLVGGGVVLPVVVIGIVFAATVAAMRATPTGEDTDGMVVDVTGHRWWWQVEYPQHGITSANEIHVPTGQPVTFRLTSADVIHSFWIPALGGKMDLLPEDVNTLVLQADRPGRYDGDCAEFCGLQHARMGLTLVAHPPAEFERWVAAHADPATAPTRAAARRGQEVFMGADCARCHTIAGTAASGDEGPDLTHLASRLTLGAGVLENTPSNLRDWIRDPQAFKPGIEMPPFDLDEDRLDDLVTYLQGLR